MSRDRLDDLLEQTDAMFPPPHTAAGMVERLRARAARQTRVRIALAAIGSVAITAAILHSARPGPSLVQDSGTAHAATNVKQLRAEIATLEATATLHEKTAENLVAVEQQSAAVRQRETPAMLAADPLSFLQGARDRAARIMLMDADRHEATREGNIRAGETYRRTARLFPETAAAREASARLRATGA
jgi:hypothetical protein